MVKLYQILYAPLENVEAGKPYKVAFTDRNFLKWVLNGFKAKPKVLLSTSEYVTAQKIVADLNKYGTLAWLSYHDRDRFLEMLEE